MIEVKAYAGLIRNYRELAAELGVDIAGCTRAEREQRLVAAAYEAWGEQMGTHLNGQFAFALLDTESQELFCARDPFGAELLFYYETADGRLLFGLEIKDLFDQPGFVRELNRDMVPYYLEFTYVPGEDTLFKGVRKLAAGGWLRFGAGKLSLGRYWELAFEPDESKSLDDWADEVEAAMDAAMRDVVDEGEVPDSFLSGGVDSSYIMAKSRARRGYCVAYEDQKASEEDEALATATFLGREFEGVTVSPEDFFGTVDEFLLAYEQPSADVAGLSLYCGCKKVKERTALCFSGEGADEFFAGYGVYDQTKRLSMSPDPVYYGSTHIMSPSEQRRYLKEFNPPVSSHDFMKERGAKGRRYDPLTWMLYVEFYSYFEGSILLNSTKISRGTGLDVRMPYVDMRMLDVARRMPARFKRGEDGNKIALRAAASRVLPHEVAYRKKLGFPVPVSSWLRDPAANADIERAFGSAAAAEFFNVDEIGALLDAFLGRKPRVSHPIWFARHKTLLWRHVWTIYLFIRWYELFFGERAK